jgi:hypothetical protein
MKRTTLVILTSLVCVSATVAVKHASAQKTDAPPPADQLDFPVGVWNCTGNLMAMGKKPGHATIGRAHSEKILDGNWFVIHYDEEQTSANTKPYHVVQYIGYDRGRKQFVSVALDNTGSSFSAGSSSGWKGNALTLDETDASSGKVVVFRDTFTRNDSGELTHAGTMQDKDKKWTKTDEETCHKS